MRAGTLTCDGNTVYTHAHTTFSDEHIEAAVFVCVCVCFELAKCILLLPVLKLLRITLFGLRKRVDE